MGILSSLRIYITFVDVSTYHMCFRLCLRKIKGRERGLVKVRLLICKNYTSQELRISRIIKLDRNDVDFHVLTSQRPVHTLLTKSMDKYMNHQVHQATQGLEHAQPKYY